MCYRPAKVLAAVTHALVNDFVLINTFSNGDAQIFQESP